ncbi:rta1 [Hyphodiscus hymeniophilus]|uniref:Rta1 n=1 Tax=Hyphodiscus hymeniophilus TaxID=353542 RepID=A0A9P6VLM0_9HELO|nr:rta1 [Hyphodiscus hymeniophilus]
MVLQSYYRYDPSLPAAIVLSVLFSLAFVGTTVQWLRYRSWVWIIMVLVTAMEAGGYIVRCLSTQNIRDKNIYVVQYCLIVLAPVFMAAVCYVLFGRIVFHVVPREARTTKLLWIPPRFVTPLFVASDILALLLQLVGAVKVTTVDPTDADAKSKASKGKKIAQIGVALQLAFFGLFTIMAFRFNFISKRFDSEFDARVTNENEKYVTIDGGERKLKKNWRALLRVTNFACGCILVRSIYRMIDFSLGRTGYTELHEWCIYVFDALPIFLAVALYIWWHPGKYLPYLGIRLPKHAR